MPVMYNAQVFPRFFSTNKELGLAYLPQDNQIHAVQENRSLSLRGSLCFHFSKVNDNKNSINCVNLRNQSAAWQGEASWGTDLEIVANASDVGRCRLVLMLLPMISQS